MTETQTAMPKSGMLAKARWAAENTPESRNRAVDFYRALAISFVILGHWLLVAPHAINGEVELKILLSTERWTQYASWLFQVMPVFFFVGGYSNGLSWKSALRDPEKSRRWAATRLARLLKPTLPLVVLWAIVAAIAKWAGVSPELIAGASQASLVPIWFLAVYIMITICVPITYAIWQKIGIWSVVALWAGAILVDTIAFGADQQWLRWSNYGFVWLGVHQLGYWLDGARAPKGWALGLMALGAVWLYVLIWQLGFPVGMVSVPGEEISNTRPPTTAMLALGALQVGLILIVSDAIQRWLQRPAIWAWVIIANQMIMTVYLWHISAMFVVIGAAIALGHLGLGLEPGGAAWWSARPIWLVLFVAALVPLVMIFSQFESASRSKDGRLPAPLFATIGALVTCAGLVMMALKGIGAETAIGVNWLAILLVFAGVGLATKRIG